MSQGTNQARMSRSAVKTLEQARAKAEEYIASKDKVSGLIAQCVPKAKQNYEFLLAPWESLQILLRMVRGWLNGRYSAPTGTLLAGIAALVYFVDPFDMIPDGVPVFGYLDDAGLIAGVVRMNLTEISRFRNWESSLRGGPFLK